MGKLFQKDWLLDRNDVHATESEGTDDDINSVDGGPPSEVYDDDDDG